MVLKSPRGGIPLPQYRWAPFPSSLQLPSKSGLNMADTHVCVCVYLLTPAKQMYLNRPSNTARLPIGGATRGEEEWERRGKFVLYVRSWRMREHISDAYLKWTRAKTQSSVSKDRTVPLWYILDWNMDMIWFMFCVCLSAWVIRTDQVTSSNPGS